MNQSSDGSTARVGRILEHEMTLVREAIAMVAGGGAPRVTVGGLHFGEALLATARGLANEAGVRLVPLWMPDDAGADIAVERIVDE
ncbi:MAG TPA: hypothetical protein VIM30_15110 [Candidatus Limnocylindrales bacterium]|jgi:hypothetical protein